MKNKVTFDIIDGVYEYGLDITERIYSFKFEAFMEHQVIIHVGSGRKFLVTNESFPMADGMHLRYGLELISRSGEMTEEQMKEYARKFRIYFQAQENPPVPDVGDLFISHPEVPGTQWTLVTDLLEDRGYGI